jgi:RNA polymerase sigma-70 factor (ECF subfamily)
MTDRPEARRSGADLTPSLIVRLRDGEPEAGALLDRIYRKRVLQFCARYLGGQEAAEDVVQDVFCKVLSSPTIPDDFRAWLYEIARSRCLDVLRSRARKRDDQDLPNESQLAADLTGNLARLVRREQRSQLRRIMASLPANQREVLRLRHVDQLSRAEIAHVLDLPESVVKSRLYEGLERLRDHTSLVDDRPAQRRPPSPPVR